jgi:hypothetical protein
MGIEQALINSFITIFSLGLLLVTLRSFYHTKNTYLLFLVAVFTIFFVKGMLVSLSLFYKEVATSLSPTVLIVFDVLVLLSFFLATLKKIP